MPHSGRGGQLPLGLEPVGDLVATAVQRDEVGARGDLVVGGLAAASAGARLGGRGRARALARRRGALDGGGLLAFGHLWSSLRGRYGGGEVFDAGGPAPSANQRGLGGRDDL